jgi:hypothetical protein
MSAFDSELDGYERLVSELRANPPVAPERLRQRVLEGAPAPRRQRSRRRKLTLVVVPVAVLLAVGAALVHGFVNSGPNQQAVDASALPEKQLGSARNAPTAAYGSVHVPQSGTTISKKAFSATADENLQAYSAAPAGAPTAVGAAAQRSLTIPKNRLVHAVASLQVGVKSSNLSAKTNEASQIVGSYGGYAQSVRYQATHQGDGEAILALRVPVQNAQKAIAKLGSLGTLLSQQVSTQDLQAKLTQQNSGIGSLRRAIAVYENALQSTTLSASERVAIQIKLNNARHALARLRHARNGTLASGATADISLLLTTRNHAIVAPHHGGSTRIGRLLGSAAHFLALEGIIVLYALIVLAPLLLLGALGWWILRERRRREDRLLASA